LLLAVAEVVRQLLVLLELVVSLERQAEREMLRQVLALAAAGHITARAVLEQQARSGFAVAFRVMH
jgi:predicted NBD/HSP70 family sugar kinase